MVSTHAGSCHCGGIRFTVTHDPVELTTCDCSLCVKRNAIMVKVPEAALRIEQGQELLALYEWNSKIAKHHFCSRCGIHTHHKRRSNPDQLGVNAACLEGVSPFDFRELPVLDGERHPAHNAVKVRLPGTLRFDPA